MYNTRKALGDIIGSSLHKPMHGFEKGEMWPRDNGEPLPHTNESTHRQRTSNRRDKQLDENISQRPQLLSVWMNLGRPDRDLAIERHKNVLSINVLLHRLWDAMIRHCRVEFGQSGQKHSSCRCARKQQAEPPKAPQARQEGGQEGRQAGGEDRKENSKKDRHKDAQVDLHEDRTP